MDPYVRQFFVKPYLSSGTSVYTAYRENPPPPPGVDLLKNIHRHKMLMLASACAVHKCVKSSRSFWEAPDQQTSGTNNLSHTLKLKASYDILNGNFFNCILQRYRIPGLVIHLWMSAGIVSTTGMTITTNSISGNGISANGHTMP